MANKVLLKRSSTSAKTPQTSDLDYGELAINYADGKLHYKNSSNAIDAFASITATATLTNKTLTNPTINGATLTGTVTIDGLQYPGSDGTNGQVLSTNGNGQLIFADVGGGGVNVGGYNNSSSTSFPGGDFQGTESYIGSSGITNDAFGVSLLAAFTCMDPIGSLQSTDLGLLT
jgi:hypothetical protein